MTTGTGALTGTVLAVVSQGDCALGFHDLDTGERLDVVEVTAEPHEMCFDPKRRLLYVSHTYHSGWYAGNTGRGTVLSVVDADRRKVVDLIDLSPEHGPHGLYYDGDRGLLYVSVEDNGTHSGAVLVIDPERRTVLKRIDVDAYGPHWFAVTPDGAKCYTANKEAPFVSVVDIAAGRLVTKVAVPGSEGIAVAPDGRHVFVAGPANVPGAPAGEPGVRVIDTATDTVVHTIPAQHRLAGVHVTSTGTLLVGEARLDMVDGEFVVHDGSLLVHSASTFEPLASVPIGRTPLTIGSSPDGTVGYVANSGSGTVTVVDLTTFQVIKELATGAGAHGLAHIGAAD
ncbi:YncE family protein [Goodfellowiella coeruleoviolacea]|uniref:40-residue YVTN family beta-propeller repeat-containing protein n=1 Tax=Goodfellowiella coeruleoviolacea TaxID=334858 RepID=A0AAE3KGJ9_9PSEU|nr:40-residue YVTN family beta-propeller repeat-containing protein [Goodfellowiella coeruleoviolacea]